MSALSSEGGTSLPWRRSLTRPEFFSRLSWALTIIPAIIASNALIGWLFNIPFLMQVQPSFVPMQFNTALGFLLAAIAIAGLLRCKNEHASIGAGLLILLTGTTLLQYLFEINLGIDELFMQAYNTTNTTFPGRMAVTTAINFLLLAAAVLLSLAWQDHRWGQLLSLCSSALVIGLGLLALVGYATGLTAAYGWGLTEMAVHSALCFSLLGIALNVHIISYRVNAAMKETFQRIVLCVFGVSLFVMTYAVLQADQKSRLQEAVSRMADSTHDELITQDMIRSRILNELGNEYLVTNETAWRLSAAAVLGSRPNLLALSAQSGLKNLIDVYTPESLLAVTIIQQWQESATGTAWEYRGHWYYKLRHEVKEYAGDDTVELLILFDLDRMLERIRSRWMGGGYRIRAQHGDSIIGDEPPPGTPQASIDLAILGNDWTFTIFPNTEFITSMQNQAYSVLLYVTALFLITLLLLQELYFRTRYSKEQSKLLNSRLSESLDAMLDAVVICNDRGRITEVNEATLTMFGYEKDDLLGKNVSALLHGNKRDIHEHYWRDEHGTAEALVLGVEQELKAFTADGVIFPVAIRMTRSMDNRGERIFIGVIHDLSKIAQAESNQALSDATLNAAMESSQAAWVVIDTEGKIHQVNQSLLNWLGYKADTLLNESIYTLYPPEDHRLTADLLQDLKLGKLDSLTRERCYLTSTGERKWGLASESIVKPRNQQAFILYQIIDISRQKHLQLELESHVAALEKSNSELDQFAYVASHDLKSPLNAIARLSSWIEEDCAELLPDKSREYLNLLHGRVNRLTHLLDDLLVYSRVGRRDHEFNYVNIKKVSEELLDLNAPDKPFSLTATEMKVFVPTVPFELVLRNLISNTIKHHDKEQGIIDVKAEVNEMGYEVRVSDNGPGIPAEFRQKAVQMFQTLQSRDETEGSGMGLAICKKTVEYYGGEFFIEDSPLGGTTIIMMWPIGQGSSLRGRKHEQGNHPLTH